VLVLLVLVIVWLLLRTGLMPWSRSRPRSRKYGTAHAKARAAAAARHQPTDLCVRCGHPLGPMGPGLHYDHNRTGDGYLGFSHARCNVRAGAREGRRRQADPRRQWTLHPCGFCGKHAGEGRKYCSQRCGYLANKDRPPKPRTPRIPKPKPEPAVHTCLVCNATFTGRKRKYCSDQCMASGNRVIARNRYRQKAGLPLSSMSEVTPVISFEVWMQKRRSVA
jgi:predicted nucleic acid-binding Zn ribbon protein